MVPLLPSGVWVSQTRKGVVDATGQVSKAGQVRAGSDCTALRSSWPDEYLTLAIVDPGAELRAGFSLRMPSNNLTDAEIADVVAFIKTLDADDD